MSNEPYINAIAPNGVKITTKGWGTKRLKVTANYDSKQVDLDGNPKEGLTYIVVEDSGYNSKSITINLDDTIALRDALTALISQTEADKREYDKANAPEKKRLKELLAAPLGTVIKGPRQGNIYTKVNDDLWHSKTSGLHYASQEFSLPYNYDRYEDVKR